MTALEFNSIISSPDLYASISFEGLQDLQRKFPFSNLLSALLAKKAKEENMNDAEVYITSAALHVPSRSRLRAFVEQPTKPIIPVEIGTTEKIQEEFLAVEQIEVEPVLENRDIAQAEIEIPERPINTLSEAPSETLEELNKQIQAKNYAAQIEDEIKSLEAFDVEDQIEKTTSHRPRIEPEKNIVEDDKQSFMDWINKISTTQEKNIAVSIDLAEENFDTSHVMEKAAQSSQLNPALYTETLAEIYAAQKKWEKAIEVYNGLSLKHPVKSGYFAARIAALQDHLI